MDHNGRAFGDGRGNVMNIPGNQFDLDKMSKISKAAKHYGAPAGKVIFMPGVRRVSDMEHSEIFEVLKHIAKSHESSAYRKMKGIGPVSKDEVLKNFKFKM
jgi:hypothetical protein